MFLVFSFALILILVILLIRFNKFRPYGVPPGPPVYVPVLGNLLNFDDKNMLEKFKTYRKQYGDIFSLKMGTKLVIVLNGYDTLKEALIKYSDVFSCRPNMFSPSELAQGLGIVSSSGTLWREHRSFAVSTLRTLGLGDKSLEINIITEVEFLIEAIQDFQGKPFDVTELVLISISNIMCRLVFGQRFEYSDPRFIKIVQSFNENLRLSGLSGGLNFLPFLKYVPGDPCKVKVLYENQRLLDEFLMEFIQEHKDTLDSGHIRDYIDTYLIQMSKQGSKSSTFTEKQLLRSISDLFIAGTHTTSSSIQWAILFFINNPDVQNKMRAEMNKVIGTSRCPSYADKTCLPYCEAVITEVLRCGNIAPITLPHGVSRDVIFRGYRIPKEAILFPNQDSIMTDSSLFKDPEVFNPLRFIDRNGTLINQEKVVPFSLGKRACLGETVARMELFLYLTRLVQRFNFQPEIPNSYPSTQGILGINRIPKPYRLRAFQIS